MVTRYSGMQIVRNSPDAGNKNKAVLMLENFAEFVFSLFHLLFGGIPSSCPGGTVLTAEQLHSPPSSWACRPQPFSFCSACLFVFSNIEVVFKHCSTSVHQSLSIPRPQPREQVQHSLHQHPLSFDAKHTQLIPALCLSEQTLASLLATSSLSTWHLI